MCEIRLSENMVAVGLDMGTSYVKCVFDNGQISFPSLYAYAKRPIWENDETLRFGVGDEALKVAAYSNSVVIRPIVEGRPIHKKGVEEMVREVKRRIDEKLPSKENNRVSTIVVGLPDQAEEYRQTLNDIINDTLNPEKCVVVQQGIGTMEYLGKKGATVMDIGQGTTEIAAIENMQVMYAQSVMHGCDFITSDLGEFAFLDLKVYEKYKNEIKSRVEMLADILSNRLEVFMSTLKPMYEYSRTVILSGGGVLVPELKDELKKRIKVNVEISDNPVMGNAEGLYKIAARGGII